MNTDLQHILSQGAGIPGEVDDYRVITDYEDGLDFLYYEDFLSAEQCGRLVDFFKANEDQVFSYQDFKNKEAQNSFEENLKKGADFYDNRTINVAVLEGFREIKALTHQAQMLAMLETAHFFKWDAPLYPECHIICKWPEGIFMDPHADNEFPDGAPHPFPHRRFIVNLYLNDDFEGGDIFFVKQKIRLKPKPGLMIGYTAGLDHMHGVTKVLKGNRYTIPVSYSHRIENAGQSAFEVF